jgi:hypothetical protein
MSPLLAHDPLHSMRPAHDVNLQTIVQEVTSKVGAGRSSGSSAALAPRTECLPPLRTLCAEHTIRCVIRNCAPFSNGWWAPRHTDNELVRQDRRVPATVRPSSYGRHSY